MKRFTETLKWNDPWFRKLNPANKLLWQWLCDNCDGAGFINPDWELASFQIGENVSADSLTQLSGRLVSMPDGSFWIPKFIKFQYGKLSKECKTHNFVFAALAKRGIDSSLIEESETRGKNGIPAHQRLRIIARDGLICAYSGKSITLEDVQIDHVQPKLLGGSDLDDNLVVSSSAMNQIKADKPVDVFCRDAGLDFKSVSERLSNRLCIAYPKAIHSLQEQEKEKEKEKEKSIGSVKNIYGEFKNVLLTDNELTELKTRFPAGDAEKKIENLSQYIASHGKKYHSHYATILNWARDEQTVQPKKEVTSGKLTEW